MVQDSLQILYYNILYICIEFLQIHPCKSGFWMFQMEKVHLTKHRKRALDMKVGIGQVDQPNDKWIQTLIWSNWQLERVHAGSPGEMQYIVGYFMWAVQF